MVKIVASIPVEEIDASILKANEALASGADMVEFRLDALPEPSKKSVDSILSRLRPDACIFTVRSLGEGGVREHANWGEVLSHASGRGGSIDVEAERFESTMFAERANVLISRHGDMVSIARMREDITRHPGASMYKGAFRVVSLKDVFELVSFARELRSKGVRFTLSGMGPLGPFSRYLLPLYGSAHAYVHVGAPTADGQPPLGDFRRTMSGLSVQEPEGVLCLLGKGIGQSLSPAMHNAALRKYGIDWVYLPLDVGESIQSLLKEATSLPIKGFNVTIPYKEEVLPHLDQLSPECAKIKAVNTIVIKDGKLWGHNTDAEGFERALMQNLRRAGVADLVALRAMVIGAGGSARAAVYSLSKGGADVFVFNRTKERAEAIAREFGCRMSGNLQMVEMVAGKMDLIVNCTPMTSLNESPVPQSSLLPKHVVMDMVYRPFKTRLLKEAAIQGARTIEGLHMLAHQAALSFELWTGRQISADFMLEKGLGALLAG